VKDKRTRKETVNGLKATVEKMVEQTNIYNGLIETYKAMLTERDARIGYLEFKLNQKIWYRRLWNWISKSVKAK
jgi:hypothetical protein